MELRKTYTHQLHQLSGELAIMGDKCIQAVELAMQAITIGDASLAAKAMECDEVIDRKDHEIEELTREIFLHQQPVAGDMRRVFAALKMITDLERIGDQAADIAEISGHITLTHSAVAEDITAMAAETIRMVEVACKASSDSDLSLAEKVFSCDDTVDAWLEKVQNDLIEAIKCDVSTVAERLDLLMVAKYLERIGDAAVNVAGWVKYAITGERGKKNSTTDNT